MELSNRLEILNFGKEAHVFSRPLQKIPQSLHRTWIAPIHFTSLGTFTNKTQREAFLSGGPSIIRCSALGNPTPHFEWNRKDGRSLQDGRFIQLANGSLMMKSVKAEDKGTYVCAIKQPRGSEPSSEKSQSINLDVLNH